MDIPLHNIHMRPLYARSRPGDPSVWKRRTKTDIAHK